MLRFLTASLVLLTNLGLVLGQAPDAEKQAEQLLTTAQREYNEGNPKAAADHFAEFLQKHGGKKGTSAARLGLGVALLDLPERDFAKALEPLKSAAGEMAFADRPLAVYYSAVALRGLGLKELDAGVRNPGEADRRREAALPRFTEAARLFERAAEAFTHRKAEHDAEWAAHSTCDRAEMELRIGKPKEARASVEPFVKEPTLAGSKFRPLALYYHGFACFLLNDIPAAGKSLGLVAPFDQPFGPHARYLLGRVHHVSGEKAAAAAMYAAVVAGYEKPKTGKAEAVPDHIAGAMFHAASLNDEAGKFDEALRKFQTFAKEWGKSPLAPDAQLRAGCCLVQLKQYDEAVKLLKPLADQHRQLRDQALYWLGKAQVGLALAVDANNKSARDQAMQAALATLRTAADRAGEIAEREKDAAAGERKVDILVDIADVLLANGNAADAAQALEAATRARPTGAKAEDVYARLVGALQISGNASSTSYWTGVFEQKFPKSALLPEVLFRKAESLHARANALAKQRDKFAPETAQKALTQYQAVITKYPDFDRIHRARFGLAVLHADLGQWEKAAEVLETIPVAARTGDTAAATYLLADCRMRTAPTDDTLRATLGNAITLLEGFIAAHPKAPEAPDALLKLGICHKRIGIQLTGSKEKTEAFAKARTALDRVLNDYATAPIAGQVMLERSRLRLLQGDREGAMDDLRPFTQEPLRADAIAPLAVIAYAALLREQDQAANAVTLLKETRSRHEASLTADPAKHEWLNLLRYHQGAALLDAGVPLEARTQFETVAGNMNGKPLGAEAILMAERTMVQEYKRKLLEAEVEQRKPGLKAEEIERFGYRVKSARKELVEHGKHMERRADHVKSTQPTHDVVGRLHYEAAWLFRTLVPFAPINPNGRTMTADDAEGKDPFAKEMTDAARVAYLNTIASAPKHSLAVDARFELAEIEAHLGRAEEGLKLLKQALDVEPTDRPMPPELAERIRFRIGAAEFDRKGYDAARAQFDAIAANPKSTLRGQAVARAAECLFAQGKFEEAKTVLKPFQDDPTLQQVDSVSDRGLLRLGHAYAGVKDWDASRVALETLLSRSPESPWKAEAIYGIGWAMLNANRHEDAVGQFTQVTTLRADDLAGRAHLQIGLCRCAQKKYGEAVKAFMTVAYGYDAPDLKYAAMLEAARALTADKRPDEAVKLLEQIVKDAPTDSDWTKAAKERLGRM